LVILTYILHESQHICVKGGNNDYINEMAAKLWTSRGGGSIR